MSRFDLFTTAHKGIRRVLFETTQTVATSDFEDVGEAAAAARAFGRLLGFLDEHARHEDEVIMPVLASLAPELFIDLRAEHARLDGLQREVTRLFARLEGASAAERLSLERRIEERIAKLVAACLLHLAAEESDASRVLWAHRDDSELRELEQRIQGGIAPERLTEWYDLVLPAVNARERRVMLERVALERPESR